MARYRDTDIQILKYYNPNVCYVCKSLTNLTECPSCRMIYYCKDKHDIANETNHRYTCEGIVQLKKQKKVLNDCVMTRQSWLKFQRDNIRSIEQILNRSLKPVEKQIFLFAKACFVCHRQEDVHELCKHCSSINVCSDHSLTAAVHECSQLKHALTLDRFNFNEVDRDRAMWKGFFFIDKCIAPDMETFIMRIIQYGRATSKWTHHDYILADDFSRPLTLCHVMKRTQLHDDSDPFVVHIISDEIMDNRSLTAWETVLHEFHASTTLRILMIGPKLDNEGYNFDICSSCTKQSNEFKYYAHRAKYAACEQSILYGPPDVIILFDVELRYMEDSTEIIRACKRQYCPVLLTATSKIKADDNIMMIRKILKSPVDPLINEKNKFKSLKPYRNYEDGSVYYPNEYLIFYEDLSALSPVQSSNSSAV